MATFTDTFRLIVDTQVDKAKSGFSSLKSEIDGAEGSWNKLKVAGGGALDVIKNNATGLALGAGTAIGAFAVKAVSDFNKVALGAGDLADKTGLTVDQASRLQEVAGDLGVPLAGVEASLNKMNNAAVKTPAAFDAIGASIAKNADGTTNVQQTFLNVIDALNRMPDAAQRAAAAQKIFGRGWQEISLLVGEGAGKLQQQLADVEKQKVVNPATVAQARDFKATMDDLHDSAEDVTLTLGKALAPAFQEVATTAAQAAGPIASIIEKLQDINKVSKPPADKPLGWLDLPEHIIKKPLDFKGNWDLLNQSFRESMGQGASSVDASVGDLEHLGKSTQQAAADFQDFLKINSTAGTFVKSYGDAVQDASASVEENSQKLYDSQAASKAAADAQKELGDETKRVADIMQAQADALQAQADAAMASADSEVAANDALQKFSDSLGAQAAAESAVADATAKHGASSSEAAAAQHDLSDANNGTRDSAISLAKATEQHAADQAAANGQTWSAVDALDSQTESLLATASQAKGPARDAILTYIASLHGIDPKILTDIIANTPNLADQKAKINDASVTRHTDINVQQIGAAAASAQIDTAARNRNATITINTAFGQGTDPLGSASGSKHARGGVVGPNEAFQIVGEEGPELVKLPAGTQVSTASETRAILGADGRSPAGGVAGAGGATIVLAPQFTINAGLGTDRFALQQAVSAAWRDYVSNNGPADFRKALGIAPVGIVAA
jgi:hypothetical protein